VSNPLVTVVLPTHNRPEWLAGSVSSVLEGEFDDFELIVSNNGRPDHSRDLARTFSDSRITWLEQEQSLNMLENVIAPLSRARGTFVAVLHDDDTWSPKFLASLVPPLVERDDAVLSFCDHYVVDRAGVVDQAATEWHTRRWWRDRISPGYHQPFFELAARQTVPITGCVFRRSALPLAELTPDIGPFYDIWVSYLLACSGGAAHYDRQRLLNYRMHSSSGQASMDISDHEAALCGRIKMAQDPRMRPYLGVLRERLARDHLSIGAKLLRAGARSSAREHLKTAAELSPSWKAVGGMAASWVAPRSVLSRL
jgi:glycosyltransferase involved in cell wall biosynthesis